MILPSDTRSTYGEFAKHDAAFHNYIANRCGNDFLYECLRRLHTHVKLFRLYFLARATTETNVEHADIIRAIADHDPAKAEAAMARHIESSLTRFIAAFGPAYNQKGKDYP
jgi:DNA-binding GntR family transcriptional regulator